MRALAAELVAQAADDDRVVHGRQRLDLAGQAAQAVLVVDAVRADHLDHDRSVGVLVEGEVGLVAGPAAEPTDDRQLGGDRVTLDEAPGRGTRHRVSPRVLWRVPSLVWWREWSTLPRPGPSLVRSRTARAAAVVVCCRPGCRCRCWCWPPVAGPVSGR